MTRPGPETGGAPSERDSVIVTPSVGSDVVEITGRYGNGKRPIKFSLDRAEFTDAELSALVGWLRRTVERKDPARRGQLKVV